MPFTPFHMGPGLAVKAVLHRHFSLTVFGFTQVAMDIEPLVRIIRGDRILHGFTHSYLGATLIAILAVVLGRPCCEWLLRVWNGLTKPRVLRWLQAPANIPMLAAISGAGIGGYSHVFLDSIMHADMRPWRPFADGNGLLAAIPIGWLHLACLAGGVIGAMVLLLLFLWNKAAID